MSEATPVPDLTKPYDPAAVEPRWYAFWETEGVFQASDSAEDSRPTYHIPMPPPNVTGSLHMGHALFCTLEDALTRYHRMLGYNTLWQPGMDHAGIATQTVVERQLLREGKTRHDLGRDAFIERVWKWKAESGGRIFEQQRVLGISPDWPRSKFTMDADMAIAVREAFVRLYDEGLMYRATRLINWCPECHTALSDLEVENEEGANGELFEFAYKVDGEDLELVVATTRPETMLGDTAVAVHPDDERYKHLIGKKLKHPFVDRLIPIIGDAILVDPKFGTGAVKVTPAHDFNDFATGKRNGLLEINIFTLDGKVNAEGGRFEGLERKKARTEVKRALDELGLVRGSKPHKLNIPRCQRSGGVVEPMISTQWFLRMKEMADAALAAVRSGETRILPAEWEKTYDHFLENIQDWCVSRQLWWGHQIPAWHGPNGEIRVGRERPVECTEEAGWKQDPDVLDTWFSSALWPFSTLGWPAETAALKKFYPASDLETGYDILFFWVARMIMFGIHFMGRSPFARVLLHGMVVDETGEKMSKVKGNVIDPLDLVHGVTFKDMLAKILPGAPEAEALTKFKKAYPSAAQMGAGFPAFGADAVRFTLATYPPTTRRIALTPKRIEGNRHFLNKIWNASRLALDLVGETTLSAGRPDPKWFFNRWILSRLASVISVARSGFSEFRIDEAANEAYRFFWTEFCDWYLEIAKTVLRPREGTPPSSEERILETKQVMLHVIEVSLRLVHPIIPFITEEVWQRAFRANAKISSVALASYPTVEDAKEDLEVSRNMAALQAIVTAARTIRSEHEVHPAAEVPLGIRTHHGELAALLGEQKDAIRVLVKTAGYPKLEAPGGAREPGTTLSAITALGESVEVLVGLKGHVTADKERARIEREMKKLDKDLAILDKKLSLPSFVDKAPPEVIAESKAQQAAARQSRERLAESLTLVSEL